MHVSVLYLKGLLYIIMSIYTRLFFPDEEVLFLHCFMKFVT